MHWSLVTSVLRTAAVTLFVGCLQFALLQVVASGQDEVTVSPTGTTTDESAASKRSGEDGGTADVRSGADDGATDSDAAPPPLKELTEKDKQEILEVSEKVYAAFEQSRKELATELITMRKTLILAADEVDNSPAAKKRFAAARENAIVKLRASYRQALGMLQLPQVDGTEADPKASNSKKLQAAATHLITVIQNYKEHSIYDVEVLEGADRMLRIGQRWTYLVKAAGRSAFCTGFFQTGKDWLNIIDSENMEDIDRAFLATADLIEEQWKEEVAARERDAKANLPRVKFKTSHGEFVIELFLNDAPSASSHFIELCENGHFDGIDFYQMLDDLLALAGDPKAVAVDAKYLADEHMLPTARHGVRGSVIMAKRPIPKSPNFVPHSGGQQFAILLVPIASASSQQTVFGRVVEGMDVVCNFRRVDPNKEKKKGEVVVPPTTILSTEVINKPDVLPEPKYYDLTGGHGPGDHAGHDHP